LGGKGRTCFGFVRDSGRVLDFRFELCSKLVVAGMGFLIHNIHRALKSAIACSRIGMAQEAEASSLDN
jgi:hypothetical protein